MKGIVLGSRGSKPIFVILRLCRVFCDWHMNGERRMSVAREKLLERFLIGGTFREN